MKKRSYTEEQRAQIALALLRDEKNQQSIVDKYEVPLTSALQWKRKLEQDAHKLFVRGGFSTPAIESSDADAKDEEIVFLKSVIADLTIMNIRDKQ